MFSFKRSFKKRWIKYYSKSNWPIIVDIASIFTVFALLVLFLSLYLYNPEILGLNQVINRVPSEGESTEKYLLDLDNPPLEIKAAFIEDSLNKNKNLSTLKIVLENKDKVELNDLKIKINNPDIEIKKIDTNEDIKFKIVSKNEFELVSLKPLVKEELLLTISWLKIDTFAQRIDLSVNSEYSVLGQKLKKINYIKSPRFDAKTELQASALYTSPDGDKLGLGPIPPIENLPTNYWVFLELDSIGRIKDFVMSSRLGKGVSMTGKYSLLDGDFIYDQESGLIVWKLKDSLEEKISTRLALELQLVPSESQVGQLANILEKIEFSAKDYYSNNEIKASLNNLDSNLSADKFNKGLGVIKSFSEY